MTWKPQRRQRIEGLTTAKALEILADDLDMLDGVLDEHIEEDETAHRLTAETFTEWKLSSLTDRNRTYLMVILALLAALAGIVTPLVTSR